MAENSILLKKCICYPPESSNIDGSYNHPKHNCEGKHGKLYMFMNYPLHSSILRAVKDSFLQLDQWNEKRKRKKKNDPNYVTGTVVLQRCIQFGEKTLVIVYI